MLKPTLIHGFQANGAIAQYRFINPDSTYESCAQAADAANGIIGVSDHLSADDTEMIDVTLSGIGEIEIAANLSAGVAVTSDADGKAIAAASGNYVGGVLLADGVIGDIVPIDLNAKGIY